MPRTRALFFCTSCGNETSRWSGQCPACGDWNVLAEAPRAGPVEAGPARSGSGADILRLGDVEGAAGTRIETGIGELDFALGGGIVPGSLVLVGGEPGIGKSTLLLQAAAGLEAAGTRTLYVSGEESPRQVRMRADRLGRGAADVAFLAATDLSSILDSLAVSGARVIILDSIQTLWTPGVDGAPGNAVQIRECAARLQREAKERDIAVLLVGHVTKEGGVAGPRMLEHIVDTVLYFEAPPGADHRVLRASKNRFGGVDEIGLFHMTASGLVGAPDASAVFLSSRRAGLSGSAVVAAVEGTRPVLVEVQALGTRASYGAPQRVANGFDRLRLVLLLAVLEKRAGVPLGSMDVFVNVAGGARLAEPAGDLAVAVALASSAFDRPVPGTAVFAGEVGLGGEVRAINRAERRLAEAARLGFDVAYTAGASAARVPGMRVEEVASVADLVEALFR